MNDYKLDNPVWYALNSHHQHLGKFGELAAVYEPDVALGAAMRDYDRAGFQDLAGLVEDGQMVAIVADIERELLAGWKVVQQERAIQMVGENLQSPPFVEALTLTDNDVPEMLALVALTRPGPFFPRTIATGQYFGIRREGRLVAMAGERLHFDGYCEVSAVCTHPDFRGRGYAQALTALAAKQITARKEIPFLHLLLDNTKAYALYKKLGFAKRREIMFYILLKKRS